MKYELPLLPYSSDALEPYIDEATVSIHHGKHHQTYIDKLNAAIEGYSQFDGKDIDEVLKNISSVPDEIKQKVINNGGGHSNHRMYWENLSPNGGGEPIGELAEKIVETFGNFEKFRKSFSDLAVNFFGSGWTWLVIKKGKLEIISRPNQESPLMENLFPILALDLWEHAYYLQYQNRRAEYVEKWWNVVNWEDADRRYKTYR